MIHVLSDVVTVQETEAQAVITLNRVGGSAGGVFLNYKTEYSMAYSPDDYTHTSGTLIFSNGQTTASITIPIIPDTLLEAPYENFSFRLSPLGGLVSFDGSGTAEVRIEEDNIMYPDQYQVEVSETAGIVRILVNRYKPGPGTVELDIVPDLDNSTATPDEDYVAFSAIHLTFPPGVTSQAAEIQLIDDGDKEGWESLDLIIANISDGGCIDESDTNVTVFIRDDEARPGQIVFENAGAPVVVPAGDLFVDIPYQRIGGADDFSDAMIQDTGGTLDPWTHYSLDSSMLSLADGETNGYIRITFDRDAITESPAFLVLKIENFEEPWTESYIPVILHVPGAVSTYTDWCALHEISGANALPENDPDSDRSVNAFEFAERTLPLTTDRAAGPAMSFDEFNGNLILGKSFKLDPAFIVVAEFVNDLQDWSNPAMSGGFWSEGSDGLMDVEFWDPSFSEEKERRFARFRLFWIGEFSPMSPLNR